MKGIVFTEFLEMVEDRFGVEVTDAIISNSELPSGGSYTAVGTYEHSEMVSLVTALHQKTQIAVPDLLRVYGEHLFGRFALLYPKFVGGNTTAFSLLESIQEGIHVEVLKLYPDAQLPRFTTERPQENVLVMHYNSKRKMADFAYGLIDGCIKHFGETASINMVFNDEEGTSATFTITME